MKAKHCIDYPLSQNDASEYTLNLFPLEEMVADANQLQSV